MLRMTSLPWMSWDSGLLLPPILSRAFPVTPASLHDYASNSAKSLQSCPTLCDPIDGSPPGSPVIWDSPGKNTGVGCHFLLQCMKVKVKSLSCVRLLATSWTTAYQAPLPIEFSRQQYWSGLPLPSPQKGPRPKLSIATIFLLPLGTPFHLQSN